MVGEIKRMRKSPYEPDWDYQLIARRFRHRRSELGITLTQLAAATGFSRYTLMRIEQGLGCKTSTLTKIRSRLKFFTDQLTKRPCESEKYSVHRSARSRWLVSMPKSAYSVADRDDVYVNDEEERHRLGQAGFQSFYTSILECELPEGTGGHALMELHRLSWVDSHYGEEFIYCLRGSACLTVDGDTCILNAGDAMCFDAWLPHTYAPAEPVPPGALAPQILIVVTARPEDRRKMVHEITSPDVPPRKRMRPSRPADASASNSELQ